MKKYILITLFNTGLFFSQEISIPIDTIVKTTHETLIKGEKIKYTAETGTQPVWNNDGKPIASLERGSFIAEISFLTGEPASADVHAIGEVIFISWKSDRLKNLQHQNPSFWMKLQHALSEDLIKKVKPQAKRASQIESD